MEIYYSTILKLRVRGIGKAKPTWPHLVPHCHLPMRCGQHLKLWTEDISLARLASSLRPSRKEEELICNVLQSFASHHQSLNAKWPTYAFSGLLIYSKFRFPVLMRTVLNSITCHTFQQRVQILKSHEGETKVTQAFALHVMHCTQK